MNIAQAQTKVKRRTLSLFTASRGKESIPLAEWPCSETVDNAVFEGGKMESTSPPKVKICLDSVRDSSSTSTEELALMHFEQKHLEGRLLKEEDNDEEAVDPNASSELELPL